MIGAGSNVTTIYNSDRVFETGGDGDSISISGFTLHTTSTNYTLYFESGPVNLTNCIIKNTYSSHGNLIQFSSNASNYTHYIKNCVFIGDGTGNTGKYGVVADNETTVFIENCIFYNLRYGVVFADVSNSIFQNCLGLDGKVDLGATSKNGNFALPPGGP